MQHKKFGLQNQLQKIFTSKFTLRMAILNLLSISDFCDISRLNLILYQIFIVIEPKKKMQQYSTWGYRHIFQYDGFAGLVNGDMMALLAS